MCWNGLSDDTINHLMGSVALLMGRFSGVGGGYPPSFAVCFSILCGASAFTSLYESRKTSLSSLCYSVFCNVL